MSDDERLRRIRDDDDPLTALKLAANAARFTLHTVLLGYTYRENAEGIEVVGETLAELQTAVERAYAPEPPPPICSGCSPIAGFETDVQ